MKVVKNSIAVLAGLAGFLGSLCLILVMLGYKPFILTSPSMEPLYPKGSLVWVNTRVNIKDVEIGDALVYRSSSGNLVLHRLVGDGLMQGDANNTAQDVELSNVNLVGKEAFTIPGLGDVVSGFFHIRRNIFVLVSALFVLACIPQRKESTT